MFENSKRKQRSLQHFLGYIFSHGRWHICLDGGSYTFSYHGGIERGYSSLSLFTRYCTRTKEQEEENV
jgi:hypothetical protein